MDKKLFQGILEWCSQGGEGDAQSRILLELINDKNKLQQHAIYFSSLPMQEKVKSLFIIHSKKAIHSKNFIKFLAVD